jgi:hypothetical protein
MYWLILVLGILSFGYGVGSFIFQAGHSQKRKNILIGFIVLGAVFLFLAYTDRQHLVK